MGISNFSWCAVDINSGKIDFDIDINPDQVLFIKKKKKKTRPQFPRQQGDILHCNTNLLINFTMPKEEQ